jgi:hypothetical protein
MPEGGARQDPAFLSLRRGFACDPQGGIEFLALLMIDRDRAFDIDTRGRAATSLGQLDGVTDGGIGLVPQPTSSIGPRKAVLRLERPEQVSGSLEERDRGREVIDRRDVVAGHESRTAACEQRPSANRVIAQPLADLDGAIDGSPQVRARLVLIAADREREGDGRIDLDQKPLVAEFLGPRGGLIEPPELSDERLEV